MKYEDKTKEQLINELMGMRRGIAELEKAEAENKQAVEALRESEERLNYMLQSIGDHMRMIDKDLTIIWANETSKKIFGNNIIGKKCYEVCYRKKEPCEPYACIGLMAFQDGKIHEHDTQVIGQDGETIYFHCTSNVALKDNEGKPTAVIEISRDITESKQAEERLRLLSSALEQSTEGIAVSDLEGNLLFVNNAFADMHDYNMEELVGKNLSIFHTIEQMPSVEAANRLIRETGEFSGEIWHVRRDGTVFPTLMHNSLLKDEEDNPIGLIGTLRDITERKQAEEKIKTSENRFKELFNNMSSGVAVYEAKDNGKDFIFKDFNQAGERIENIKKEDLIGKSVLEVFPGVTELGLFDVFKRVLETGNPEHHPISLYKDQRIIGWRENYVYKLPSGEVVAVYDDVTERKQAEEALRESEGRYRTIFEQSPDAIVIIDPETTMPIEFNDLAPRLMGYSEEEFAKLRISDYEAIESPEETEMRIRAILAKGGDEFETKFRTQDGNIKEVFVSIRVIDIADRTVFHNIFRDITERKQDEEALKEKERELEQQAKHLKEINTALKVLIQHQNEEKEKSEESILMNVRKLVLPYIEKLDKGRIEVENKTYLSIIKSNLESLVSPFANRLSSRALNLTPTEIQVADFVKHGQTSKEIASMLSVSPDAVMFHRKNIRKKLGLANKKTNLRSYLQSLST